MTLAGAAAPLADPRSIRAGVLAGAVAYAIWGLFPIYVKALGDATPLEIVAHRILWSLPVGALILSLSRQWRETLSAVRDVKILRAMALSAVLIGVNWLVYIWAVAQERVIEASLGYYINPLMFIAAGVFVLNERLNGMQAGAVALAAIGVAILTFGAGVFPWVSLILAASFSTYGFLRKTTPVGAMPGLFIETALLAPIAALALFRFSEQGALAFGANGLTLDALLAFAGPMTVAPLVLFSLAARRLRLSTLGFLQYLGPTIQFLLGLYYGETFTLAHGLCFALIWAALALLSIDAIRKNRRSAQPLQRP